MGLDLNSCVQGVGNIIPLYQLSNNAGGWESATAAGYYPVLGMGIFVDHTCGQITKYAIYASLAPILISYAQPFNTAYASSLKGDPSKFAGYICVDSSGDTITNTSGWIPGYTGTFAANNIVTLNVTDGKCH